MARKKKDQPDPDGYQAGRQYQMAVQEKLAELGGDPQSPEFVAWCAELDQLNSLPEVAQPAEDVRAGE